MKTRFSFKPIIMAVLCMAAAMIVPNRAKAQNTTNTVWKGTNIDDITPNIFDDAGTITKSGTTFFLYNVGTGKFIMQGGGWGTEAILLLQDYGAPCTLSKNQGTNKNLTWIEAAVSTTNGAHTIGCNVLYYSSGNLDGQTHNAILDAHGDDSESHFTSNGGNVNYTRSWTFERIDDESSDTYTYHLKETITRSGTLTGSGTFYLGAVSGTNGVTGDNKTAYVDATNQPTEWEGKASVSPNYQWRIVTLDQLEGVQTATTADSYGGLNANVTYLLNDPFFDRSQNSFNGAWTVESNAEAVGTVTKDTKLRRDWTKANGTSKMVNVDNFTVIPSGKGFTDPGPNNGLYATPWNDAVFRKLEPNDWPGDNSYHRDWAQYEMATLEGEGIAYQKVKFPKAGRYMLTARAFTNGDAKGFLYVAKEDGTGEITSEVISGNPPAELWHQNVGYESNWQSTSVDAAHDWVKVAKYLDDNTELTAGVLFVVNEPSTWRIGLKKTGSVQNSYIDLKDDVTRKANGISQNTWEFHHDATYVAIDNMQLHYLGENAPFAFNENKVNDSYMRSDITDNTETGGKLSNATIYLKRKTKIECWQPIVLPISLTTEQLRNAFGDGVRLGELEGVGKADAASPTSIDFKPVTLTPGQESLKAGKFYLIYATRAGGRVTWTVNDETFVSEDTYILGRHDYDPTADLGNGDYTNAEGGTKSIGPSPFSQVIADSKWAGKSDRDPFTTSDLTIHATWIRTPSSEAKENYVPAGAYVVQDGEMIYLTNPGRINGFKWWITAPEGSATTAKGLRFSFVDPSDFVTYIDGVSTDRKPKTAAQRAVYNLAGVRVANDASELQNLPSGIYITGGKKIIKK